MTLARTPSDDALALTMRHTRTFLAARLCLLPMGAAAGDPQARTRLRAFRQQGAPCPNPDRQQACLRYARRAGPNPAERTALERLAQTAHH